LNTLCKQNVYNGVVAPANRTFSFRASDELAERLAAARRSYPELAADASTARHIQWELQLALLRRLRDAPDSASHGTFIRDLVEAFVGTVEKAARYEAAGHELESFDQADTQGPAEREAFLEASAATRDA
jgi:hypothetical protein